MELEEWIKMSIPAWERILKESIEKGDTERQKYAEWMLKEVLGKETNGKET